MSAEERAPAESSSKAERWKCDGCGAAQRYDAATKKLECDFCGATRDVPNGSGAVVEHDLFAALASMPEGLGTGVDRVTKCKECGATVHFNADKTAAACAFCGSSSVLVQSENRRILRPESLVPFAVDKKQSQTVFGKWLGSLWFRPSDLRRLATVQEMQGVYVPFWTYDAHVESEWRAEAGYHYYVTEEYEAEENGETVVRTREVEHTRWEDAWGQRADDYDDVLVCASTGLPAALADSLKQFDTKALVPYTPAYLAGWSAEEYGVELKAGFAVARSRIDEDQEKRCASDVPGDTQRGLDVSSTYSDLTWKHVLLPIWIAAYRYRGEVYRFLVNGQTGEIRGRAPYSAAKIALAVFAGVVALLLLVWLLQGRAPRS